MSLYKECKYNSKSFGICNVEENYNFYFSYLLSKLNNLFVWENLPESIDELALNTQLFLNGNTCFTEFNGKLYCLNGNLGSTPNEYYFPTKFIIANPILGNKEATILGENADSVMMYNSKVDALSYSLPAGFGLYQLIKQTATLLADNIVSISCAQINSRVQAVHTAESESMAKSAEMIIKDMYMGKPYRVVTEDEIEKFNIHGTENKSAADIINQLIELQQYIIGQFYMSIGVKYNAVNKKERLITDEINFQDDFLDINLDTMLQSRLEACEKINKMFGTNITCKINPILQRSDEDECEKCDKEDRPKPEDIPAEDEDTQSKDNESGTDVEYDREDNKGVDE